MGGDAPHATNQWYDNVTLNIMTTKKPGLTKLNSIFSISF